ncbi:glycosyltransferase family 2 protein [Pseudoxanthomonas sp. LjRoot143]|uniref:glycosyltransferase family 2 protein n=1 Tax=Pseudoxanthomonas sp. LjRoot143 TaxID=3342266 RepID=UPI003ECCB39D
MKNPLGRKALLSKVASTLGVPSVDVQQVPLELPDESGGTPVRIKVDVAVRLAGRVLVGGWSTGPVQFALQADGRTVSTSETRFSRQDVATHLSLPKDAQTGFVLIAEAAAGASIGLSWAVNSGRAGSQPLVLRPASELTAGDSGMLGPSAGLLTSAMAPHTPEWRDAITRFPAANTECLDAKAHVEAAHIIRGTGQVVVVGWLATKPGTQVWGEDDAGNTYELEGSYRLVRNDVHQLFGALFGASARMSGFIFHAAVSGAPTVFRIKALSEQGVHLLSEAGLSPLSEDPATFARWLFGVGAGGEDWAQRVEKLDAPLVSGMIERSRTQWNDYPVSLRECGTTPVSPEVSIVVPLYGRVDFVESQMLAWVRDGWLRENAQLIYVLDDPGIVPGFRQMAEELYALYRVPFTWVWGGVNRGFSGANNLGAEHAKGKRLLFLNSDVFPRGPGWLPRMMEVLDARTDVGAVGPRLLFADGGIQHAGMRFAWLPEHDVFINEHPMMGLDPSLDRRTGIIEVPAVTGACLLVRREDFDRIGGWDTGYLIGDFEDSDFCLKLRAEGLSSAYLPEVELIHLERQSMTALGSQDFRGRVTLWNALRHQSRWREQIESSMEAAP